MDTTYDGAPVETVSLRQGTIEYRDTGPEPSDPVLFVHGAFVNGTLWRNVVNGLVNRSNVRCLVPTLPLGGHSTAMNPETDLTPPGFADLLRDFLDALGIDQVTLIGNDTGGAICQVFLAHYPERVSRLVLTNCDAFDNFPPLVARPFTWAGRVPGATGLFARTLRSTTARRLAFKILAKQPIGADVLSSYVGSLSTDSGVQRDLRTVLVGVSPRYTNAAAETFPAFDRPVLIVWALDDPIFPLEDAERLAERFPNAQLERIEDSYALVPEDQPERLVESIVAFVAETDAERSDRVLGDGVRTAT